MVEIRMISQEETEDMQAAFQGVVKSLSAIAAANQEGMPVPTIMYASEPITQLLRLFPYYAGHSAKNMSDEAKIKKLRSAKRDLDQRLEEARASVRSFKDFNDDQRGQALLLLRKAGEFGERMDAWAADLALHDSLVNLTKETKIVGSDYQELLGTWLTYNDHNDPAGLFMHHTGNGLNAIGSAIRAYEDGQYSIERLIRTFENQSKGMCTHIDNFAQELDNLGLSFPVIERARILIPKIQTLMDKMGEVVEQYDQSQTIGFFRI